MTTQKPPDFERSIDRQSPLPFYYQLQEILKEEVEAGRWLPGDKLPSEGQLQHAFQVSRTVVRQALDVLESDGQVHRRKGVGAIVSRPKFRVEGVEVAEAWGLEPARDLFLGRLVGTRRVVSAEAISRVLGIRSGDYVFELTYVQSSADGPVSLTQSYIRCDASPSLASVHLAGDVPSLSEGGGDPLRQLWERYGLEVSKTQLSIEVSSANQYEAEMLGISLGNPTFLLSAVDLDPSSEPVRFSRSVVRSDVARFMVVFARNLPSREESGGILFEASPGGD